MTLKAPHFQNDDKALLDAIKKALIAKWRKGPQIARNWHLYTWQTIKGWIMALSWR